MSIAVFLMKCSVVLQALLGTVGFTIDITVLPYGFTINLLSPQDIKLIIIIILVP